MTFFRGWLAIILTIGALFCAGLFGRYSAFNSGPNVTSVDYATHLAISQHLEEGIFFPEINNEQKGKHSVSKILPIYHGILGFHVASLAFEWLGLSRSGSYLLILDFSLLISLVIFSFYLAERFREVNLVALVFSAALFYLGYLSYFIGAVRECFFSQIFSYSLVMLGFYFWHHRRTRTASLLFLWAVFTYPDYLIYVLPAATLVTFKNNPAWQRIAFFVVWLPIAIVPFLRRDLLGLCPTDSIIFFLMATTLLFFKDLRNKPFLLLICLFYVFYTFILGWFTFKYMEVSYYSLKLMAFGFLLLPVIILEVDFKESIARISLATMCLCYLIYGSYGLKAVSNYFFEKPAPQNLFYGKSLILKNEAKKVIASGICPFRNTYALFSKNTTVKEYPFYSVWGNLVLNAQLINFEIGDFKLMTPELNSIFKNTDTVVKFFEELSSDQGVDIFIKHFVKQKHNSPFCICVSSEFNKQFSESPAFQLVHQGQKCSYFKHQ